MLKQGLKNYFRSLKHFFTPLGTMFLGLLLGLSVFIPGTVSAVNALIDDVKELAAGVNLDFGALWDKLRAAISALDWSDPVNALETMLSGEWINEVLTESLSAILGEDFSTFAGEIALLIDTFTVNMVALTIVWLFFFIVSFIAGFMLTKFFIRRNIAKRSLWKWLLASVINALLTVALIIVIVCLYALWKPSAIFSAILLFVLPSVFSLASAYLVYAFKKVKFSKVLNLKNTGFYLLGNVLILLISGIFTVVAVAINALMGAFVGLAIFEIALCVMGMNADSYVQELIKFSPVAEPQPAKAA